MKKRGTGDSDTDMFLQWFSFDDEKKNQETAKYILNAFKKRTTEFTKTKSKRTSIPESSPDDIGALLQLTRYFVEGIASVSLDRFLRMAYTANYGYICQQRNKVILNLIKSYAQSPKDDYHAKSSSDLEELISIIEQHSNDVMSKWTNDGTMSGEKYASPVIVDNLKRLVKIYIAMCVLKEIASVRSMPKNTSDVQFIPSIIKIAFNMGIGKLYIKDESEVQSIKDWIVSLESAKNIDKRWGLLKSLKEKSKELAGEKWSNEKYDDKLLHHEMAEFVYDSLKNEFSDLIEQYRKKTRNDIDHYEVDKYDDLIKNYRRKLKRLTNYIENHSDDQLNFRKKRNIEQLSKLKKCVGDPKSIDLDLLATNMTDDFFIKTIRKAIYPLAKDYDRAWGIEGAKK